MHGVTPREVVFRHAHMACGIGAGARGFNLASPRVGNLIGRFECAGGIDVDAGAIRNFERLTGVKGTVMDLFSEEQYRTFHGKAPPPGWREATPDDIRRTFGRIDILFASYPCKGFSGLLSAKAAETAKYEALNALTIRGMLLSLEAYKDDPVAIVAFENVPRIATKRGEKFLAQIDAIYRGYGYVVSEVEDSIQDCGEIGGLGQSRKRFLRLYRYPGKVPNFIYQPEKKRLRGVGEIIGKLPLPGDPRAGVMHRVPALQWKTWVRLAFVPAGKDWRALNDLAVIDGRLRDFGIVPDRQLRDGVLGVMGWDETAGTIVGNQRSPLHGRHSVADPRTNEMRAGGFGVVDFAESVGTVAGESLPSNGRFSVADPRIDGAHNETLGVRGWEDPARVVAAASRPMNGAHSVADPRVDGHPKSVQLGVRPWDQPAPCIKGDVSVGTGPYAISDPRVSGKPRFNNVFRIVGFDQPSPAVAGPGGPAGGLAVADPRMGDRDYTTTKYQVTPWAGQSRTVIAASTTGEGAFAVADPRGGQDPDALHGKHRVTEWDEHSRAVIAGRDNGASAVADPRPGYGAGTHQNILAVTAFEAPSKTVTSAAHPAGGALSVADPRPAAWIEGRENFNGAGNYGVVPWERHANTVSGSASYDNGYSSVADPREPEPVEIEALPAPGDRLVCRIIARDETWHRPFTTLELAALQSLFDPEEVFDLDGGSDATKREWIGNAVPSLAARGMAEEIGEALLLARLGETFTLSSKAIWVKPFAMALAVDGDQIALQMDVAAA